MVLLFGLSITALTVHDRAWADPPGTYPARYWTYTNLLTTTRAAATVNVQDMFFTTPIAETPVKRSKLAFPVQMTGGAGIPDSASYYQWWDLSPKPAVSMTVQLTNAYGSFSAQIVDLEFMLVPAVVNSLPSRWEYSNHYLGYAATQGFVPSAGTPSFHDIFLTSTQTLGPLAFICVPCVKDHSGAIYPIEDPITCLAAYPITPSSRNFNVSVLDQFFSGSLSIAQVTPEYALIPSTVTVAATDAKRSSWGRLKQLYR